MSSKIYDEIFFKNQSNVSFQSAIETFEELLKIISPNSVADIGCGVGAWLAAFKHFKPDASILGVDGAYVPKSQLCIDVQDFNEADLSMPLKLNKKFDIVWSLEVGEHLPTASSATFVKSLTAISDVILFSAAIPLQGGTNHINEQYPEFWAELFAKEGYVCADAIRKKLWNNNKILWPYRQNMLFFIKGSELKNYPALAEASMKTDPEFLFRVHPHVYNFRSQKEKHLDSIGKTIRYYAFIFKSKLSRKISKK